MGMTGIRRVLIATAALGLVLAAMPCGELRAQAVPIVATPVPVPTPAPTPIPAPTPKVFSCSCYAPGQPVAWMGRLSASNYILAEQAAQGQCLGYLSTEPGSPLIQPPSSTVLAQTQPLAIPRRCTNCACN